jgi:gamma-glutamyl AIG2-like cyclotransferase
MGAGERHDQLLFCYGTLCREKVQLALFGRRLEGGPDAVTGYRLGTVEIGDPELILESGAAVHPILVATGDPADRVAGTVFRIDAAELAAADDYEVSPYIRVRAPLRSGGSAWAYAKG